MSTGQKWIVGILLVLFCGLAGLWLGVRAVVQYFLERKLEASMSAEEKAEMERFFTEPVYFPAEWQEDPPLSADLIAAASAVRAEEDALQPSLIERWDKKGPLFKLLEKLKHNESLSSEEWRQVEEAVAQGKVVTEKFSALVARPDYEMKAYLNAAEKYFLSLGCLVYQLGLQTYANIHKQQYTSAGNSILTVYKSVIRRDSSNSVEHIISTWMLQSGNEYLLYLARHCPDPQLLRYILSTMEEIQARIYPQAIFQYDEEIFDQVIPLREYRKQGYTVDLTPGHPLGFYFAQYIDIRREQLRKGPDRERVDFFNPTIMKVDLVLRWLALPSHAQRFLYKVNYLSPFNDFPDRFLVSRAKYDLACLELARRIRQLEGDTTVLTTSAEFYPQYLSTELHDPFTASEFLWDASSQQFYSVGPDKTDEGNRLEYDPTNGISSAGDIALGN